MAQWTVDLEGAAARDRSTIRGKKFPFFFFFFLYDMAAAEDGRRKGENGPSLFPPFFLTGGGGDAVLKMKAAAAAAAAAALTSPFSLSCWMVMVLFWRWRRRPKEEGGWEGGEGGAPGEKGKARVVDHIFLPHPVPLHSPPQISPMSIQGKPFITSRPSQHFCGRVVCY